jgi:hypothetical protein
MKEILEQLISAANVKTSTIKAHFNEPAAVTEIIALQSLLDKKLPKDFIEF